MNNESLLLQLVQELANSQSPTSSPIDILFKLRPMLTPREQKYVDLMIKFQEVRDLMDEIHSENL